jgi:putative transposase
MKLESAGDWVTHSSTETLPYYACLSTRWRQILTKNLVRHIIHEIGRGPCGVGAFLEEDLALMLVAAGLRRMASTKWGKRRYPTDRNVAEQSRRQWLEIEPPQNVRKNSRIIATDRTADHLTRQSPTH